MNELDSTPEDDAKSLFEYLNRKNVKVVSVGIGERDLHVYINGKAEQETIINGIIRTGSEIPFHWEGHNVVVHEDFDVRCNEIG